MGADFKWSHLPRWLFRTFIVAGGNFMLFLMISLASGGDALSGKKEAGRYFLASHGHYTEASRAFYYFSYAHGVSVFLLIYLCLVSVFWFTVIAKKKDA